MTLAWKGASAINSRRIFKSYRGVEQGLARWAHNPKVGGSNPSPAIFFCMCISGVILGWQMYGLFLVAV